MKVVNVGDTYRIYSDNLKVSDKLAPDCYIINFSMMQGFYLSAYPKVEIKEEKIYGVHNEKVGKVIKSFDLFNRNLGIIMSGKKGIGKSLFATLLAEEANKNGYPLVIVNRYTPGIADFINSIQQECMFLFDEFDKTFGNIQAGEGEQDAQASMLSLFDGLSNGKKMFVITCNDVRALNDYLINRPGRFHYHFRFDYPTVEEIEEYLHDKLEQQYYGQIKDVVAFSRKVDLNFDSLRAIAFELNLGGSFKDIIKDLNIINMNEERYILTLTFENGRELKSDRMCMDLFGDHEEAVWAKNTTGDYIVQVRFNVSDCIYDSFFGTNTVQKDKFSLMFSNDEDDAAEIKEAKQWEPARVSITRWTSGDLHYAV